jgi:hypothetical protein
MAMNQDEDTIAIHITSSTAKTDIDEVNPQCKQISNTK